MNGKIYFFSLIAVLISAFSGHAALPTLTPEKQGKLATHVITGVVKAIFSREEQDKLGTRTIYTAKVEIVNIEKGSGLESEQFIDVEYWRIKKRPNGWVGNSGQRSYFKIGNYVRFFLRVGEPGKYNLLTPNGAELMKTSQAPK